MRALIILFVIFYIPLSHLKANNIQFEKDVITIKNETNQYTFYVEIATSAQQRSIGLMHRTGIKQNEGMLFIYPKNQVIKMWMKNTLIPLDMLFIKDNGEIEKIFRMTTPKDLTPLGPDVKLKAVLEIQGGLTTYLKIKKGDYIIHKSLNGK